MKKIFSLLILSLFYNCNKDINHEEKRIVKDTISQTNSSTFNFNDQELQGNLNKAILEGDTIAYRKCYKKYVINGRDKEFLYYAIIMAEKNNYKGAYYDISRILAIPVEDPLYTRSIIFQASMVNIQCSKHMK
ncbi:hypothetical protein [Chryseobacterium wanjuense]